MPIKTYRENKGYGYQEIDVGSFLRNRKIGFSFFRFFKIAEFGMVMLMQNSGKGNRVIETWNLVSESV